jgi:hypothetical protein
MSKRIRAYLHAKYAVLPRYIATLEPSAIVQVFKAVNKEQPHQFYPHIGLSFAEFSVAYCYNLHK